MPFIFITQFSVGCSMIEIYGEMSIYVTANVTKSNKQYLLYRR